MASSSGQVYQGPPNYGMKLPDEVFLAPPGESTFQYQDTLPSLPVPDLDHTLKRYLESLKPLLSEEEMRKSEAIVQEFGSGVGRTLHKKLEQLASKSRNWLAEWWDDLAYLYRREPHVPDINILGPAAYHMFMWPPKDGTQCERAAMTTWFTLKFWEMLRKGTLRVDRNSKKEPLCMNQLRRLLNDCKIPGLVKDTMDYHFKTEKEGPAFGHICVLCRGRIFTIDILDSNGDILTVPELQLQYERIREHCDRQTETGPGLGSLTGDDRVSWYKARQHLLELHPDNQRHLHTIETAIFFMALEDTRLFDFTEIAREGMLGDGVNRWFDKGFTLIMSKNGMVSCNCDHAPAEGMVMVQISYYNLLGLQMCKGEWLGPPTIRPQPQPQELVFHLDNQLLKSISNARQTFQKNVSNVDVATFFFKPFGKSFIRKHKLHPDAFVQVAMQCAYYRIYRKAAPTYETATIRKFYAGRTETTRSCTMEALDFSKAVVDPAAMKSKRLELMIAAIEKHIVLNNECQELKGCDRHLLALQLLAAQEGLPVPEIYKDPAYVKSGGGGNYILSSSFVGYTPVFGGTAAMCPNGYGVFYSIPADQINFFLSCWKSDRDTGVHMYYGALEKSLLDMKDLLDTRQDSAKL